MLNKRDFDRFCGLFARFVIGEDFTEEDERTRAFKLFKSLKIDEKVIKSLQKYEQKCERIRQKQDKNEEKNITQNADTQTTLLGNTNTNTIPNTNTNTILKEKDKKESAGKPPRPTLEEIKEYVKGKKYTFDSEAFFNFYESNGWKVGKNPMKSWQAACVTWQKRHNEFNNNKNNNNGRDKNNNDGFSGTGYTGDTI